VALAQFSEGVNRNARHRLLITGANGFVGRALAELLHTDVRFQTVYATRNAGQHASGTNFVSVGDISGDTDWTAALAGVQTVVHLAARVHVMRETAGDPLAEFRRVNVEGTRALAKQAAAAGVERFLFLSSIKVNGETGYFSERDAPRPVDAYGNSKHEAEQLLSDLARRTRMQVVIIRPPLVYGPGVKANFRMLLNLVARGIPLPFGAVHNRRSFVAVQNLTQFILHCVEHPLAGNETFLISDDEDLSTPELVRRMALALGKPPRLVPIPEWILKWAAVATGQRGVAERLLGTLQLDIAKARNLLGWTPPVTVDEALRSVVAE
jgi:nucleoside-diphosphate-sugar epimerase